MQELTEVVVTGTDGGSGGFPLLQYRRNQTRSQVVR
jgi:hypothetical protein